MKPLFIVVEGPTEKEFVDNCLKPYLRDYYGIYDVSAPVLGVPGHKGGRVAFSRVCTDVKLLLKQRGDSIVTTLMDYYGMRTDFPGYEQCQQLTTVDQRIDCLEGNLFDAIGSHRFFPYFQKHEFEALIFSTGNPLNDYLNAATCETIKSTRNSFYGPEEINSNKPPSYRLQEIFKEFQGKGYKKIADGSTLVLEIGFQAILQECPRFANWVQTIVKRATID